MNSKEFESEPFLDWIDDVELRYELHDSVANYFSNKFTTL